MFVVLIIIFITSLISGSFFARRYDMSEKVDKGIELCYWKLSYRRKFVRTLWLLPVFTIVMIRAYQTLQSCMLTWIIGIMLFGSILIQAIYNYRKWKNEIEFTNKENKQLPVL